ncbi:hypothetical protein [Streptococcus dysgalactiae]|uniref:hypothetical protein n=1 Tax=Streptococcus dysgalactiae TaxID=1334 RepID=UPI0024B65A7D|nr:hypothetical protein [Streptococcus dysgalactiae]
MMKKNNGVLKIILIIIALAFLITILAMLMPVAFICGIIATWYYTKKKPNQRNRNIAIAVAAIGLVGSIFLTPSIINNSNPESKSTTTTTTTSSSKSVDNKKSTSATTSNKKETTPSKTELTIKNDGPKYTKESNAEFATVFQNVLNNALAESGMSTTVRVEYYDNTLIYVYVPQEYKYETNVNIQRLADTIYQAKENKFNEWAIDKGYDLGYTHSPTLYLKSEDDTVLAEESGILKKKMKLKINNS